MSVKLPLLVDLKFDRTKVGEALAQTFADRKIINLATSQDKDQDLSDAGYALLWKPDFRIFAQMPNLKAIFSGGAGVDHLLSLPQLPDVPLIRFVDPSLTTRMSEWIVLQCLIHLRKTLPHLDEQRDRRWSNIRVPEAREVTVGIMGLGVLGQDAAAKLQVMGFNVIGWSRTAKQLSNIETYDAGGLEDFLKRTEILVGLLPLTAETERLYDHSLFAKLRKGGALGRPVFINAGRGRSQVESDLVAALEDGTLGGASLDVFEIEPLPQESPLWQQPNVVVTPHDSAVSDEMALMRYVGQQIQAYEAGGSFDNLVDRKRGY